ncbi:PREDICTED: protein ROOT PRIMORDIUM DEFECTIVE 1 [Tarenaya hassleriana]|uniref:protein ROOT PRIMORDIUM DEFECTIVE 1 n=1 Tax=Tarenaya hassleriana TaxID=28532 RepID=UPI00053C75A0|nr:PREDICTED: protein ROOT PRIMORDIUM DEFECTIVE 1 [Tarenaya hassleriana]
MNHLNNNSTFWLRASMAALSAFNLPRNLQQIRSFINARVKWVRDPFLDEAVQREKNLKQLISLKDRIISSPSKSLPLSSLSPLKPLVGLPESAASFFRRYPSVFTTFQSSPSLPLHARLTPQAVVVHKEEQAVHDSLGHRSDVVRRLTKLLMLTRAGKLPLYVVDRFRFDLGLPHDYLTSLIGDYPDYFDVAEIDDHLTGEKTLALGIVSWRNNLAVSEMESREALNGKFGLKKGLRIRFSMNFPKGYDLEKRVRNWVDQWQDLPYISPYEDAFHLGPSSDQAEKWTVAVLYELLWLLVSKKTERDNLLCLGDYLGFGTRFRKALMHHPGIFYLSNKIRTQTVVLREAYSKDFLIEKHPLMGMRHRYIHLMNQSESLRKRDLIHGVIRARKRSLDEYKGIEQRGKYLHVFQFASPSR